MIQRRKTKQISVGQVVIGDGAPIAVQSMTNTLTNDVEATVRQIHALERAGCEIIRVAVPDLASAAALNRELHQHFGEDQVYRIDHYLGKETVQNLTVLRFANTLIEPIWNRNYVDHVQITVAEDAGIGTRAGYFDSSGSLRDMVQNHLLQLVSVVAMEPPATLDSRDRRDEKVKVFRSIRPLDEHDLARQ